MIRTDPSSPRATAAELLRTGSAEDVRGALLAARERTLTLGDDYRKALGPRLRVPRTAEVNPPLWEWGHVAWFQERWIARNPKRGLGVACDPDHPRENAFLPHADDWYDSSQIHHPQRWQLPLPDFDSTRNYLAVTLDRTLQLLGQLPDVASDSELYFYRLAALHEQMHAEAAVYMAHVLDIPVCVDNAVPELPATIELVLPGGPFTLGSDGAGFVFDNELQSHEVDVAAARVDSHPVTWARFLPFVEAGGYETDAWWDGEAAAWLAGQSRRMPACLRVGGSGWEERRTDGWHALNPRHAAIHLNAHEAEAWCRWAGRRLPTEAEWECAALTLPEFSWGQLWEWTASHFLPYPGFEPHPYRDYSAPWFGTRRVLRGASIATSRGLAHPRYRNFFEPHRIDVLAGFRSCSS